MNVWKEIWTAYHSNASVGSALKQIWLTGSRRDQAWMLIGAMVLVVAAVLAILESKSNIGAVAFLVMAVVEVCLLIILDRVKNDMVLKEFGDTSVTQVPPEMDLHRDTRYLSFKRSLANRGINAASVDKCTDLIDLQIDMSSTEGRLWKSFFGFVLGVASGVATAMSGEAETRVLFMIAAVVLSFGFIGCLLLALFRSRVEKLKELKYFMKLYSREISTEPAWLSG